MSKNISARCEGGFNLIELMIVVAIIGILATVAIPTYIDYIIRAKVSTAVTSVQALKTAVSMCGQEAGNVFTTCASGSIGIPDFTPTKEVSEATIASGGVISMTFSSTIADGVDGKVIKFTPSMNSGLSNIVWTVDASAITNVAASSLLQKSNL